MTTNKKTGKDTVAVRLDAASGGLMIAARIEVMPTATVEREAVPCPTVADAPVPPADVPPPIRDAIETAYPRLVRTARLLSDSEADADDLVQETILQAIASAPRFRGESRIETWLFGILFRLRRQRLRALVRQSRRAWEWAARFGNARQVESPEAAITDQETQAAIWSAVKRLSSRHRDVLILRFVEDLPLAEIAKALKIPEGTVKSRLHHALEKLKTRMTHEQP